MCWKLCEEGEETVTRGPGVSQDVLVRPAFGESYIMFELLHKILVRSNFGKEQATSFGESCLWFLTLSTLLLLRTISWMIQLRESPLLRWWTSNGRIIPFLLRLWSRSPHWIVFSPPVKIKFSIRQRKRLKGETADEGKRWDRRIRRNVCTCRKILAESCHR